MRRETTEEYYYKDESTASFGGKNKDRRRFNQEIRVGGFDEDSPQKVRRQKNRDSSNDRFDYNVDESMSEDGPTINKNSYVFNTSIGNRKKLNNMNMRDSEEVFDVKRSDPLFGNDQNEISPINSRDKYRNNEDKRPSDLVEFTSPLNAGKSPVGYNSTQTKARNYYVDSQNDMLASDSSDDGQVLDSSDFARRRNKDVSPHNRFARPRSS